MRAPAPSTGTDTGGGPPSPQPVSPSEPISRATRTTSEALPSRSDLRAVVRIDQRPALGHRGDVLDDGQRQRLWSETDPFRDRRALGVVEELLGNPAQPERRLDVSRVEGLQQDCTAARSEEHTSELK